MSQANQKTSRVKVAHLSRQCVYETYNQIFVDFNFIPLRYAWMELCHLFIVLLCGLSPVKSRARLLVMLNYTWSIYCDVRQTIRTRPCWMSCSGSWDLRSSWGVTPKQTESVPRWGGEGGCQFSIHDFCQVKRRLVLCGARCQWAPVVTVLFFSWFVTLAGPTTCLRQ